MHSLKIVNLAKAGVLHGETITLDSYLLSWDQSRIAQTLQLGARGVKTSTLLHKALTDDVLHV